MINFKKLLSKWSDSTLVSIATLKKIIVSALVVLILNGCASTEEHQNKLIAMAYDRANLLSTTLPIELNHLKITQVTARKNVVDMMITYNQIKHSEQTLDMLIDQSIARYCRIPSIRKQIDFGLVYHLRIRNTLGQLLMDKQVSKTSCH